MNKNPNPLRLLASWRLLLPGFLLCLAGMAAQRSVIGPIKGFKIPDYYPAQSGQTNQMKSLLCGDEARPQFNGQVPIKGLHLITFNEDGRTNLIVETDQCVFYQDSKTAASERHLQVHSGDRRLTIDGDGFSWQQTNSSLVISNAVRTLWKQTNTSVVMSNQIRTVVQQEKPVHILADHLLYDGPAKQAAYQGHVQVNDPQMEMTSEFLTIKIPEAGKPLESVVADTNVLILGKQDDLRATGARAEYMARQDQEIILLTGNPTWQRGLREGKADRLQFDRKRRTFFAEGHTWTKLPLSDMDQPVFWLAATNPATPLTAKNTAAATNQFVEIFSEASELQTNDVSFRGNVIVKQPSTQGPPTLAYCDYLHLESSSPTGKLESVTMEKAVLIQQGDSQVSGGRMVYSRTNEIADFTDNPAWKSGPHEGSANLLRFFINSKSLHAQDKARMKLHSTGVGLQFNLTTTPATNAAPSTNQYLAILSDEYDLKPGLIVFRGHTQARDYQDEKPKGTLLCEQMTVRLSAPSNQVESILAERKVVFEQGILGVTNGPDAYQKLSCQTMTVKAANGQLESLVAEHEVVLEKAGLRATGDRLDYDVQTEEARLTGHPVVETDRGKMTGSVVIFDRKQNKYFIRGQWKGEFEMKGQKPQKTKTEPLSRP